MTRGLRVLLNEVLQFHFEKAIYKSAYIKLINLYIYFGLVNITFFISQGPKAKILYRILI